jgi:tetratricopeptide (TPR) repeat protein
MHQVPRFEAFAKTNLANLQIYQDLLAEAEETLSRAEAICRQHQGLPELPEILYLQAEIVLRKDKDPERALGLTEESLQEAQASEDELQQGIAWRVKGDILCMKQHFVEALAAYQTSLERLTGQDPYQFAKTQLALARHHLMNGQKAPAKTLLTEALATFERLAAKREIRLAQALLLAQ